MLNYGNNNLLSITYLVIYESLFGQGVISIMEGIRGGEFQCDQSSILNRQLFPRMQHLQLIQVIALIDFLIFALSAYVIIYISV